LLRLAQGQADSAAKAIRRALEDARESRHRASILAAATEILLAADDRASARTCAEELSRLAGASDTLFLKAIAAHASGSVLLAEGDPGAALGSLGEAAAAWRRLDAPYQAARARLLVGRAHRALGDEDSAALEIDAARQTFTELGAALDLQALESRTRSSTPLTSREIQVLRLVATGKTNRAIAERLGISEKTVARHLSNIFTKLDLSTRAAATAYAYQHDLAADST
jgi:DNA-binding CsgD family transcriptional regulator